MPPSVIPVFFAISLQSQHNDCVAAPPVGTNAPLQEELCLLFFPDFIECNVFVVNVFFSSPGDQSDHQEGAADRGPGHGRRAAGLRGHRRAQARLPGEQSDTRRPCQLLHARLPCLALKKTKNKKKH